MKVLVACEFSGIVREAFKARGHDVWSCDILETEIPGQHIKGDVLNIINDKWDLMIGHPPCTFLANSGVQHLYKDPLRFQKMKEAVLFFNKLLNAPIEKIAIENPIPHGYTNLPKYTQIIHPWEHGHEVQKKTCLWLKNLPPLKPTNVVDKGKRYITKSGKSNGSYWYQILSLKDRAKIRSRTFKGIATAMAEQWG